MDNGRYLYVLLSVQGLRLQVDLVAENYGKILLRRKAVLMQMTYPGPALPGGVSFEAFWEETSPLLLEFEVVGCGLRDRVKRAEVLLRAWGVRLVLKRLRYRDLSELAGRCYGLAYCSSTDLCSAAGIAPIPAVPGAEEFRKIAGYFERKSPLSDTSLIPETAQLDTAPRRQRVITRRQRPQQREQALSLRGRHVVLVGTFRTGTREEVRRLLLARGVFVDRALHFETDYVIVGDRSAETGESAAAALFSDALRRQRRRGKPRILSEKRVFSWKRRLR